MLQNYPFQQGGLRLPGEPEKPIGKMSVVLECNP